jgi:tRNA dimethylallyltransferase
LVAVSLVLNGGFVLALPVIFLMGATATGKTEVALSVFDRCDVDIISVDSAMVYRGMDVGTGKPSKAVLSKVPHQLIDICEPYESYSVSRFRDDALRCIGDSHARQRVPLLVGGSNLYFRMLDDGMTDLPMADPSIRKRLEMEAADVGWAGMHKRLVAVDATAAARIHPHDAQRIQRALEVYEISSRGLTEHYHASPKQPLPFEVIRLVMDVDDRAVLHQRIEQRFLRMLDDGLVDEVNQFYHDDRLTPEMPAMRLVGYRQVWHYLDSKTNYATMIDKAVAATRQLAKRQMTWLRRQSDAIRVTDVEQGVERIAQQLDYSQS